MQFSITITNYVYDEYIKGFVGNRSKYIEEYFVRGYEVAAGSIGESKRKVIDLIKLNRELQNKNHKLEGVISQYRQEAAERKLTKKERSELEQTRKEEAHHQLTEKINKMKLYKPFNITEKTIRRMRFAREKDAKEWGDIRRELSPMPFKDIIKLKHLIETETKKIEVLKHELLSRQKDSK